MRSPLVSLASLTIAFAGITHAYLAPEHFAHAPAHGLFFAVSAVVEIAWAYIFFRRQDEKTYYAGLMIAGGLIILWAATRVLPAPFEHEVGVVDLGGVICKTSELVGMAALLILASQGKIAGIAGRTFGRLLAEGVILSFFVASLTYVAGHDFEPLMPFLAGEEHQEQTE
jgi:hypothetical protein